MMREWWRLHLDLMREYGISKDIFSAIAENHQLQLRDGAAKLFKTLNTFKVPFVIMSAGLGDLIISLLQKETLLFDNVHVISNMFEWDQSGKAKGLANNVIHSSNKHEIELKNRPFYNDIAKRKNIILLGDSEGDIGMAAGLSPENILKIGFLNEEVDARLEMFEAIYDVVLLGDGDLSYVNDIVSSIVGT